VSTVPVPPQNLAAEEYVLGAILLAGHVHGAETSSAVVAKVRASGLVPADFYRESHGLIYEAALAVVERGEPTDAVVLEHELEVRGTLTDAGGTARLRELAALVPAIANAGHHAGLVVDAAERREEVDVALALRAAAQNGGLLADDALRERVGRLLAPRRSLAGEQIKFVTFEEFIARHEPQAEPLVLDAEGGTVISATGLGMVYGTGGAGKTTLWLDAAMHFAGGLDWLDGALVPGRKLRVAWIEKEGPREEFRRKLDRKLDV
jgi:DnaB-like helicase N terminal domain/AAA domain